MHCEVVILAGGLSSRMGRDKARLRLGPRSLLGHVRATVRQVGLAVRTIRRDRVARCGPLGGICTALHTSRAEGIIFLSCDMPFVSSKLLQKLLKRIDDRTNALFVKGTHMAGFPCWLRRNALGAVEQQ